MKTLKLFLKEGKKKSLKPYLSEAINCFQYVYFFNSLS